MNDWTEIRRRVLVEGVSRRQILRESGMHRKTLKKILEHSEPPGYRQQKPRPRKKLGAFLERIGQILKEDRALPPKQRHTAKRIWERLRENGFTGGYTVVKDAVRELTQKTQEVFVPLLHRPGEAQVDFGHALANVNGQLRKVAFFVMALPYSDATFVMAFERECTETFWEGHVRAFEFFKGVPNRITYDNTKVAVSKILGKERRLTQGFLQLKSHYLFDHHFCRVARGNEKGVVEGQVKFTRLNYFVPVPQVRDMAELNAHLFGRCVEDQQRQLRGQPGAKAQLLLDDQKAFLPLPATPFEACRKFSTTASSLSLVRFDGNDYSVPVRWAHHPIVAKGYFDCVVLCADGQEVARHARIWEDEQVCFEPLHYLALLETKPGALDHARPLAGWTLPECFALLRRRLEAEREGDGTREYIKVLRLLEQHSLPQLRRAVEQALAVGAITRDAVAQFLYPQEDWGATLFSLDGHPHLRHVRVAAPDLASYAELVGGVASASWIVAAVFTLIAAYAATANENTAKNKFIVRLKGFIWTREDFCRGWLITGDTGSGKTRSGINQLLFQVFQNDPNWGGLCIDDKGVYWETLVEMAAAFHRENDLILLQVRPDDAPHDWKPRHTFNPLSNPSIPPSTYAKFVVDTVTSLGQRSDQSFFKNQAQTHIGLALELLSRMEMETSLQNIREFLLEEKTMEMVLNELKTDFPTDRDLKLRDHFEHRYRGQPAEQMGGVKETIANYLQFFLTPDIAEIFCASKNSFDLSDIDRRKIICVAMPQKYQMQRRYINTFLKMLFYTHALRRFDRSKEERATDNLIILWADEAQRFVSASEDGMSDYNCVDVMREAKATLVAAAQSSTSFIPPLGEEKAQVLTLNLRNRMIFKAADEIGVVDSADFLGQRKVRQKTSGYSGGMLTRSYTNVDEHKIKPYELRNLRKHQCILVHCEKGFRKTLLPPLEPDGKIPKWFPWWKQFF